MKNTLEAIVSVFYLILSALFFGLWTLCIVLQVQTSGIYLLLLPATLFLFVGLFRGAKHEFPDHA